MKVSIIIPIYNVASYIRRCLLSVLNQTYKDLEVIIINDQTRDNSIEIIQETLKECPPAFPVKILNHTKNKGLSAARNTGIINSTGEYLYFLDSDDEITQECIETLVNTFKTENPEIIIGDYLVQGSNDSYPPLRLNTSVLKKEAHIFKAYGKGKIYVMAWNKLVQREFILKYSLFFKEGVIHEDCLWSFQCICHAKTIAIIKQVTYLYKIRKGSITTLIAQKKELQDSETVLKEMILYAKECGLQNNKYIMSFMEKEKLRLLYTYLRLSSPTEGLYQRLLSLPHPTRLKILQWGFFSRKKMARDAHYFLPHDRAEQYYIHVPEILLKFYNKEKNGTRKFYAWFLQALICYALGKYPSKFHIPLT